MATPRRTASASNHRRVEEIIAQRDRLAAEVSRLERALGSSARFAAQARELLTRAWGKADWSARQDLVKAAQWLIDLELQSVRVAL